MNQKNNKDKNPKLTLLNLLNQDQQKALFNSNYDSEAETVDGKRIILVETPALLMQVAIVLSHKKSIAIDLEFDDNKNRYGRHLGLVQIFDGETVFLVDAVALHQDLRILFEVFAKKEVAKVFHSCNTDLLILDELYHCKVVNIEDSSLMHKILSLSYQDISLKHLIAQKLNILLEKTEQTSNWLERPLRQSQIIYAAKDVCYLLDLMEILRKELSQQNRLEWYEDERKALEKIRFRGNRRSYTHITKRNKLSHLETELALEYWRQRDELARKLDKPSFMLFTDSKIVNWAKNPPKNAEDWRTQKQCHPIMSGHKIASVFDEVTQKIVERHKNRPANALTAQQVVEAIQVAQPNYFGFLSDEKEEVMRKLKEITTQVDGQNLQKILMPGKLKKQLFLYSAAHGLKPWQLKMLETISLKHEVDFMLMLTSLHFSPYSEEIEDFDFEEEE